MDWAQLLVLFILVGIPLLEFLGRVLTQRGGDGAPPPPELEATATETPDETGAATGERTEPDWPMGWGERPAPAPTNEEPREMGEEALDTDGRELPFPHDEPEAERVSAPVVSLEPTEVDHDAGRGRSRRIAPASAVPALRATQPRLGAQIRSREDLRRAIVLMEVLGPPRGFR